MHYACAASFRELRATWTGSVSYETQLWTNFCARVGNERLSIVSHHARACS